MFHNFENFVFDCLVAAPVNQPYYHFPNEGVDQALRSHSTGQLVGVWLGDFLRELVGTADKRNVSPEKKSSSYN